MESRSALWGLRGVEKPWEDSGGNPDEGELREKRCLHPADPQAPRPHPQKSNAVLENVEVNLGAGHLAFAGVNKGNQPENLQKNQHAGLPEGPEAGEDVGGSG